MSRWLPEVLRIRRFRLWWLGSSLSELGTEMAPVTLTFAVLTRYHSAGALGVVLTAEAAPVALLLLAGGVVGDRVSRRVLLLSGDVVSAVVQAVGAALLASGHWQLWQLAALSAVQGAVVGLTSPALIAMVTDLIPPEGRKQANSLRGIATSAALVAGPALGGVVAGFAGGAVGLAVNAGTYAVSALLLVQVGSMPAPPATGRSALADLREGWREFTARTWLWAVVAQYALFHLLVLPPVLVLGALVSQQHLGGAQAWGAALAAFGLGSLVGSVLMLGWHPRRPLLVATAGGALFAGFAIGYAVVAPFAVDLLTGFVAGLLLGIFDVLWNTALTTHVPTEALSRVSAYDWFGSVVLLPVGYTVVGPVAAALGAATVLWAAAAVWVAACALVLGVRQVRALPA